MSYVNHRGEEWKPSAAATTPKPKARAETRQSFFKGYVVVGYRPGEIAEALRQRQADIAHWKLSPIGRCPSEMTASSYMNTTKPKRVRARPYEVESAAEVCAELARRNGWEHVRVEALSKGETPSAGLW